MQFNLNEEQQRLLKTLSPFEHYITGGAVRDLFLEREPSDIDISVVGYFDKVVKTLSSAGFSLVENETAFSHGIVRVATGDTITDVCMTRVDKHCDGRTAVVDCYNIPIEEDLMRRDFTINSIAAKVNENGEVIGTVDPNLGIRDIARKHIKFVGNPILRIQEDYLRMLRYCRFFALSYGWTVPAWTDTAVMGRFAPHILNIPKKRIWQELVKIFRYPNPAAALEMMRYTQLLLYVLPQVYHCTICNQNKWHGYESVWNHSIRVLNLVCEQTEDPMTRMAAMFHDIGKPRSISQEENGKIHFYGHEDTGAKVATELLSSLGASTHNKNFIVSMTKNHKRDIRPEYPVKRLRRWARRIPEEWREAAIILSICDYVGHKEWDKKYTLADINRCKESLEEALKDTIIHPEGPKLAFSGHTLIQWGLKPGSAFADIKNYVEEQVAIEPCLNTDRGCKLLALERIFQRAQ